MPAKQRQKTYFSGDLQLISGAALSLDSGAIDLGSGAVDLNSNTVSLETISPTTDGNSSGGTVTAATNAALTFDRVRYVRHARLTLTDLVVSIDEADDYGGTKICDLPDSNLLILGSEVNLSLDKDGVGIVAATDVTVGLGTAVASNSTLSGAMIDLLTDSLTTDEDPTTWADHTHEQSTPALTFADDSATGALYLNAAATLSTSGTLTVTGTVDIFYLDTGNVTS